MKDQNNIAESVSLDEAVKQILETYENSTPVVGWYAHPEEVRGPYCRWLTVSDVNPEYKKYVAAKSDETKFIAAALNFAPKLAKALEYARTILAELKD